MQSISCFFWNSSSVEDIFFSPTTLANTMHFFLCRSSISTHSLRPRVCLIDRISVKDVNKLGDCWFWMKRCERTSWMCPKLSWASFFGDE